MGSDNFLAIALRLLEGESGSGPLGCNGCCGGGGERFGGLGCGGLGVGCRGWHGSRAQSESWDFFQGGLELLALLLLDLELFGLELFGLLLLGKREWGVSGSVQARGDQWIL